MTASKGFTLVELLVAIFIAAVMFAVGYSALTSALDKRRDVEAKLNRIGELQTAFRILQQDVGQLAPRPLRDEQGGGILSGGGLTAVNADPRTAVLVGWTRGGWANPAGVTRGTLQRVQYTLDGDALIRQTWPVSDVTQATKPVRRTLLKLVKSAQFRYLDSDRVLQPQWPPATPRATAFKPVQRARFRPIAIELNLELTDFGKITRLFECPG